MLSVSSRSWFMPAFYKIDKEHKVILSTASGVFDLAAALEYQDQLLADPEFNPSYSQLLDFSHVTEVKLSSEDVRRLAERRVFWPCSRRAILVRGDLEYGFVQMFEMLRKNAGDKGIRAFRNLDEALTWIFAGRSP
jgi:hypothetical protein